jgi:hypothetical protein
MALLNLESLVLRGVAVLRDELALEARPGTSEAGRSTPASVKSKRHSTPAMRTMPQPVGWLAFVDYRHEGEQPGAGRSRSQAGIPGHRPHSGRSSGSSLGGGWPSAAAACCSLAIGQPAASVAVINSGRPSTTTITGSVPLPGEIHAWWKPLPLKRAGWGLAVATRGVQES